MPLQVRRVAPWLLFLPLVAVSILAPVFGLEGVRNLVWSVGTFYGAYIALYALYLNGRRTDEMLRQNDLAERGQVTERYTRAVTQLGHTKSTAVRIGGLYALERVAQESKKERKQIIEIIANFVRGRVPKPDPEKDEDGENKIDEYGDFIFKEALTRRERLDIEAAIKVLSRTAKGDEERESVDLSATDLRGLHLSTLNLSQFYMYQSHLSDSLLIDANLSSTFLEKAYLIDTRLSGADLSEARLFYARLRGAEVLRAKLFRTRFFKTDLTSANFRDAEGLDRSLLGDIQYREGWPPNLPGRLRPPKTMGNIIRKNGKRRGISYF